MPHNRFTIIIVDDKKTVKKCHCNQIFPSTLIQQINDFEIASNQKQRALRDTAKLGGFWKLLKKKKEIKCVDAEHTENKQWWKVMKKCRLISNTTGFLIILLRTFKK